MELGCHLLKQDVDATYILWREMGASTSLSSDMQYVALQLICITCYATPPQYTTLYCTMLWYSKAYCAPFPTCGNVASPTSRHWVECLMSCQFAFTSTFSREVGMLPHPQCHLKTLSMPRARPKCSLQLDPSTIRRLHSHFCTSSLFFWNLPVLFLAFASPLHPIWFCAFLAKVRGWIPQGKMMKVWKDSHRIIKCQHTSPKGNRNANSWNLQRLENAHFLPLRMDLKICFPHPS